MADFPRKLEDRLQARREDGSFRSLHSATDLVDFSSNDYLGFARLAAAEPGGHATGSTGSRLISGNHSLYGEAEATIRDFHGAEAALLFNSGYDANVGMLPALLQRNDFIFYDASAHASIRDGISLGKAKSYKYDHNSLPSLKERVRRVLGGGIPDGSEVYVVTETVFSMEGDGPGVGELAEYCRAEGFRLILDEAHAAGVLGPGGRGVAVGAGCEDSVFARIITYGKAFGCHGAAVLGSALLRDYLINFSRSLIYTTALPPASVHAIMLAYDRLGGSQGISARERLFHNIGLFNKLKGDLGLEAYFIPASAGIHCCEIGGNDRVRAIAEDLGARGYEVKPILAPTVPRGRECLRFSLHAFNTSEEITGVLTILGESLRKWKV